jgi:hypothetical protein
MIEAAVIHIIDDDESMRRRSQRLLRRQIHSPVRKSSDTLRLRGRPPAMGRDPFFADALAPAEGLKTKFFTDDSFSHGKDPIGRQCW